MYFCASMAATSTTLQPKMFRPFESLMADYRLMCVSREASLLGRKEVLTGKAKFGTQGRKGDGSVALTQVVRPELAVWVLPGSDVHDGQSALECPAIFRRPLRPR